MKTPKITPRHEKIGKLAKQAFDADSNPASWVEDEDVWEKAKTAASKSYDEGDDVYWPSVVAIYENMGGGIKSVDLTLSGDVQAQGTTDGATKRRMKSYREKADSASAHSKVADKATDDCDDCEEADAAMHHKAAEEHQTAAEKHKAAMNANDDEDVQSEHKTQMKRHETAALDHIRQAKVIGATMTSEDQYNVHCADGKITGKPSFGTLTQRVNQSIQGDARWDNGKRGSIDGRYFYGPYCMDILVPDDDGRLCAVIRTNDDKTVKHYFEWDGEMVTLADGDSEETEMTSVYASQVKERESKMKNLVTIYGDMILARHASAEFEPDKALPKEFMWMPGGVTTVEATFNGRPIQITVECDEETEKVVSASFDSWKTKYPNQKPFGCVEHREEEAAFWPEKFAWKDEPKPGVFCSAEWSGLGERNVKEKIHRSFSPSFATDANYAKAEEDSEGVLRFPDGVKGSASNPARVTGVAFSVGSLTNKPAFKNILPVKAKDSGKVEIEITNPVLKTMVSRNVTSRTLLDGLAAKAEANRPKPINLEAVAARRNKLSETIGNIKVVPETAQQKVEKLWARTRSTGRPLQN